MDDKSLDDIMLSFDPGEEESNFHESHKPLTVWVPNDQKMKYSRIQKKSRNKFSKKLRELIIRAIEKTECAE